MKREAHEKHSRSSLTPTPSRRFNAASTALRPSSSAADGGGVAAAANEMSISERPMSNNTNPIPPILIVKITSIAAVKAAVKNGCQNNLRELENTLLMQNLGLSKTL